MEEDDYETAEEEARHLISHVLQKGSHRKPKGERYCLDCIDMVAAALRRWEERGKRSADAPHP